MSRIDSMARFEDPDSGLKPVGKCCDYCFGELYKGDYVVETVDGDILHEECANRFFEDVYIERKYYAGEE